MRARVFQFILSRGLSGATLEEIHLTLGIPENTARPRRKELEAKGWVIDSGRRRTTRAGRDAIVWIIPDAIAARAYETLDRITKEAT